MKLTTIAFFALTAFIGCTPSTKNNNEATDTVKTSAAEGDAPADVKNMGPIKVTIANNARTYLLKDKTDTVEFASPNLSATNKVVLAQNAKLQGIGGDKYLVTALDNSQPVKIILGLRKHPDDMVDMTYTPVDSAEIEVK